MKKLFVLISILLLIVGCKKDDEITATMVELKDEIVEKGWDYLKISAEYSYPEALKAVNIYLSENSDMSGAEIYECNLDGKTISLEVKDLKDGVKYYYHYEYDNGYEKKKGEKRELMVVITNEVAGITLYFATCGGNIASDGNAPVTARGVCWSTSPNPTIADSHTTDGSGMGSFTSQMTGLTENTTYYVRAYATTEKEIVYGVEKSFTTLGPLIITVNGASFTMIAVEGGTFLMGAQADNPNGANYDSDAYDWEKAVHPVTLSVYYIGETEVTQELWEAVMGGNPSYFNGYQRPIENVSWDDCQDFITELNRLTGMHFRLPTEAEWEYAARGGNKSMGYKYSGSNTINNVAWYGANSNGQTHNVKTQLPNELGIYDMNGNVLEWCQDWYYDWYSSSSQTNPQGPSSGSRRVLRGGSWVSNAWDCRVSYRYRDTPADRDDGYGLRLSL